MVAAVEVDIIERLIVKLLLFRRRKKKSIYRMNRRKRMLTSYEILMINKI